MEITGRITADAKVNTLQDERQVVNFTIAINDYYKPKGSEEGKQLTTFVNCSYWLNAKIARHLLKGSLVQVSGRIGVWAYKNMEGEAKGALTFHVNNIKLLGTFKRSNTQQEQQSMTSYSAIGTTPNRTADDLPF